jgi:AmmeMemoRadiSam system protein A
MPLTREEWPGVDLSISVLTPAVPLACNSEAELLRAIRPGVDGLILADENRRGLFLPAVWEQLADPVEFVRQLKRKAGLSPDHWSANTRVFRFTALSISHSD